MMVWLLMEDSDGEAETAVEENLGSQEGGNRRRDFWSGRILEAPCPPPVAGRLGHWTPG